MSETEKLVASLLGSLLLILVPGFLLHVSPRFAGSLLGGALGIGGALLLVLLLVYPLVKYVPFLRRAVTGRLSLRALLTFHIYAGVLGPMLGILHSGHKYQSPLGIGLVVVMLLVVISGFIGRYYLTHVSSDLREQETLLATLRSAYDRSGAVLEAVSVRSARAAEPAGPAVPLRALSAGIAELEYATQARQTLKRTLARWTVFHVAAAILLYLLLALHVWSGLYYGLRWLP